MKKILGLLVLVICGYAFTVAADPALSTSVPRTLTRGEAVDYTMTVSSNSNETLLGVTVGVNFPVSYFDASSLVITPSDYSIVGDQIVWNNQNLSPMESRQYKISGRIAHSTPLGLYESTSYILYPQDTELTNNSVISPLYITGKGTATVKSNMPGNAPIYEDIIYDVSVINQGSLTLSNLVLGYFGHSSFVITSITPRQGSYNGTTWTIPEIGIGSVATISVAGYFNSNNASSTWRQLKSLSEQLNNASLTSQLGDAVDSDIELEIKPEITGTTGSRSPVIDTGSSGSGSTGSTSGGGSSSGSSAGTGVTTGSVVVPSGGAGSSAFSNLLVAGPSGGGSYGITASHLSTGSTGVVISGSIIGTGITMSGSNGGKRSLFGVSGVILSGSTGMIITSSGLQPIDFDWIALKSKLPTKNAVIGKKKIKVCSSVKRGKRYLKVCR